MHGSVMMRRDSDSFLSKVVLCSFRSDYAWSFATMSTVIDEMNAVRANDSIIALSEWRSILEPELRARSSAFAEIEWPLDFEALPVVPFGFNVPTRDAAARIELLLDRVEVFVRLFDAEMGRVIESYEFAMTSDVKALILVRRGAIRLIQLEVTDMGYRLLIHERLPTPTGRDVFVTMRSNLSPARTLQQLNASGMILRALEQHFVVSRDARASQTLELTLPAPEDSSEFAEAVERLRAQQQSKRSTAIASLFSMSLLPNFDNQFLTKVLQSTLAIENSVQTTKREGDDGRSAPPVLLTEASHRLAESAPGWLQVSQIHSLLAALYITLWEYSGGDGDENEEEEGDDFVHDTLEKTIIEDHDSARSSVEERLAKRSRTGRSPDRLSPIVSIINDAIARQNNDGYATEEPLDDGDGYAFECAPGDRGDDTGRINRSNGVQNL